MPKHFTKNFGGDVFLAQQVVPASVANIGQTISAVTSELIFSLFFMLIF